MAMIRKGHIKRIANWHEFFLIVDNFWLDKRISDLISL